MIKNKIDPGKDDSEYFDDCAICHAMKEADEKGQNLGMEDLERVFAKQNLRNKLNRN